MDEELNHRFNLTSANSINVARFLPQAFYYFNAYAQMKRMRKADNLVVCVPSGNLGNITAGLFAQQMGLPIKNFIAANNANDVFYQYLQTGYYTPQPSKQTIANAMDVGDPSNFARILALYNGSWETIVKHITGATYTDNQIREIIKNCYGQTRYILDPHGACAYRALTEKLKPHEVGIFLETAHPSKFKEKIDDILETNIEMPERLAAFIKNQKQSLPMNADFQTFKSLLLNDICL